MKLEELQLDSAQPLRAIHDKPWLDTLLKRPSVKRHVSPMAEERLEKLNTVIAVSRAQRQAADELVRRRYCSRGYATGSEDGGEASAARRHSVTLLAQSSERLLGTLSVIPDSPQGLLGELTYPAEIEALRGAGHRLGELVRLAICEDAHWRAPLDALVQSAYLVTRVFHGLSDVLIEVNPRHAPFYRRAFGFVEAGAIRLCERVNAPSVLMRLELAQFGRRLSLPAL